MSSGMSRPTEHIYTPESQLRRPGLLFGTMWRDLAGSLELAWRLAVRDITSRYRRSLLGITWAIFPPIVGGLVFILLRRGGVLDPGETKVPYPVYVMTGMILWTVFTRGINAPLKVITASAALFSKVNFPREALVLSAMYQVLFEVAVKLVVLAGVFAVFGVSPSWGMLALLPAILMLMLMGIAVGLLLVPLGLLYTDVTVGLPVVTGLWFLVSGVAFQIPGRIGEFVFSVNPVCPLLFGARDLATTGTLPGAASFFAMSAATLAVLLVSWVLYRLAMPVLVERMQA
jgi:lipopolysaccharide transport system permease protein